LFWSFCEELLHETIAIQINAANNNLILFIILKNLMINLNIQIYKIYLIKL
jgi:hypothetical protein